MPRTRPLSLTEVRIVGALMEKEQTTPDQYPLSLLSLRSACNQKTNREPVSDLSEAEVLDALETLRQDVLVWRTEGARVERWQHSLDRRWELDSGKKAVMTLLLLRGPQTPGELRSRSDRLHPFSSLEEVESTLRNLATGFDALVRELPREPGQRETRWMHLAGDELPLPAPAAAASTPASPTSASLAERVGRLEAEVAKLGADLAALRSALGGT